MKRSVWVLLLAPLILAGIWALWLNDEPRSAPGSQLRALRWPSRVVEYSLDWSSDTTTKLGQETLGGGLKFKGVLAVRKWEKGFVAEMRRLERSELRVLDQAVHAETLEGVLVRVELDECGRWLSLSTPSTASPVVGHLMSALLKRVALATPSEAVSEHALGQFVRREEATSLGRRVVGERFVSLQALPGKELGKEPGVQQAVESEALFRLAENGELEGLELKEKIQIQMHEREVAHFREQLSLERLAEQSANELSTAGIQWRRRDAQEASKRAERKALESRAAHLEKRELLRQALVGPRGSSKEWLFYAQARLQVEPSTASELGELLAIEPGLALERKRLSLDLLAQADTPEAQAALREVLQSWEGQIEEGELVELVQRLGMLQSPQPESVAMLIDWQEGAEGELRTALHYTAGSMVRAARGSETDASALLRLLEDGLATASNPAQEALALRALGNAGAPESLPLIVNYTSSGSAQVRAASATALRHHSGAVSQQALLSLVADEHVAVQQAALDALRPHLKSEEDLSGLARAVMSSSNRGNDGLVVTLIEDHRDQAAVEKLLRFLLERSGDKPKLRARIRSILG